MPKISSADFLEMNHPVATMKWQLPVVPKTTGGRGSLFGGAGLAAGIVALEQATEKPIVWDRTISVDHPAASNPRH